VGCFLKIPGRRIIHAITSSKRIIINPILSNESTVSWAWGSDEIQLMISIRKCIRIDTSQAKPVDITGT